MAYNPPRNAPPKPDCGPFQIAEWAKGPSGRTWIVRDMTAEEIAAAFPPPDPSALTEEEQVAAAWKALRAERNSRLASCDWTQVPDAPVDAAMWAAYRQALRDLPAMTADPSAPVWPTAPTA